MSVKELITGNVILGFLGGIIYVIVSMLAAYFDMTKVDIALAIMVILSIIGLTIIFVVFMAALATIMGGWTIRKYREYKNTKKYP